MDTKNTATAEVPTFKLAKVGKDRERRRGSGWWNFGRNAGSGFRGAAGGAGAAGMSAGKLLTVLLVSALGAAGAWRMGSAFKQDEAPVQEKAKLFSGKSDQKYDDLSGVVKNDKSIPNSLSMVSGSADGLTDEERAKKAADEEAARKAEEEAKKKAEAEANKEPATPGGMDLSALAGAGDAGKKGMDRKFGQLSSNLGKGSMLMGGAGLAGGVGRGFTAPTGKTPGNLSAFRGTAKASSSKGARASAGRSNSRGFAKKQLLKAFALSRPASSAGKAETSSDMASSAFGGNPAGTTIGVPSGTGLTNGNTDNNPSSNSNTGGPTNNNNDCTGDTCLNNNNTDTSNVCPYQSQLTLVKNLLTLVFVLSLIAMAFKALAAASVIGAPAAIAAWWWISKIIAGLGLIIAEQGYEIYKMHPGGDKIIGGIITCAGGIVTTMALTAVTTAVIHAGCQYLVVAALGYLTAAAGSSGGSGSHS